MITFAAALIKYREDETHTQSTLGAEIGINQDCISEWESGRRLPSMKWMKKLSIVMRFRFIIDKGELYVS